MSVRRFSGLALLCGTGIAACNVTGEIVGDGAGGQGSSGVPGMGYGGASAGYGGAGTAGFPAAGNGGMTGLPSGGTSGTPVGGSSGEGSGGTPAGGGDTSGGTGGDTSAGGTTGGSDPSGGAGGGGSSAGSGGSSAGSGGSSAGSGGSSAGTSGSGGSGGMMPTTLVERIHKSTVTVAAGVKAGVQNWSIWDRRNLVVAPVYTAPLAGCETLVCFTSGSAASPTARIVRLNAQDQLVSEVATAAGFECRGLAAGAGGQFAALLWDDAQDDIWVRRYGANGSVIGSTALTNADNNPTDFGIGESRLEFGGGEYGAYYHVHSDSGHEGDTLKWVDGSNGVQTSGWGWGCSHSMSNVLRWSPEIGEFMPACVTDCYPGTDGDFATMSIGGIYLNHDEEKVMDVDAACNGNVAAELGSAAASPNGWKLIFNAHQAPVTLGENAYDDSTMNQDIGFSSIVSVYTAGSVVWLTNTPNIDEMDSSIARFEPAGSGEQYLVGWVEGATSRAFKLALLGPSGSFIEAPITVTNLVQWGRRDDPFRQHYDGDVVWAWFDSAGSTTLNIGRVDAGLACQ
jgi:hypothetical protein